VDRIIFTVKFGPNEGRKEPLEGQSPGAIKLYRAPDTVNTTNNTSEIFALLRRYAPFIGSYLSTFHDSLSVPSSTVKQFIFFDYLILEHETDVPKRRQLSTN
jgi:hypothetical protein